MNQQILSQDEVDALLQGITGESQKLEQEEAPSGGIRDYDLASQERIVRGRMPTMEVINERFARNIRIGLFNFIRKSPEVAIGGIKVQKYSAFLREIVVPTNFNIMSVKPLRGSGLIVCDPNLVFAVIDSLFGGAGSVEKTIAGALIFFTLNNGFNVLNLGANYQGIIEGSVLVVAAATYTVANRRAAGPRRVDRAAAIDAQPSGNEPDSEAPYDPVGKEATP